MNRFEQEILDHQREQIEHIEKSIDFSCDRVIYDELEKSRSGIYKNTHENRKRGIVGAKYGSTKPTELKKEEGFSKEEKEKNFKEWFGDSKVVDEKGNPLKMYHGTNSNFNEFKQSESIGTHGESDQLEGIYFTDNKDGANWYALVEDDPRFLKETYLSIKNPFIVENHKELREKLKVSELKGVKGKLENLGFDGLIIKKGFHSNGLHALYLAFNPNQIKSATNNSGAFDSNSNDITKSI